jgi:apolipoprotein N-acyltransferase
VQQLLAFVDKRPWRWLLLGGALLAATQVRAPLAVLAWVAPIPWLRYLRLTAGWPRRLAFFAALLLAWTLAIAKMASAPRFLFLAPAFALPIMLAQGSAYLAWRAVRGRTPPSTAALTFAVAMALGEWVLHSLTPFGSWGATAYTQIDNLPLLQVASVFGIAGVGAVVSFVAASLESALAGEPGAKRAVATAAAAALIAQVAGTARLAAADVRESGTTTVAAIFTDADVGGLPLPSRDTTHRWDATLLGRTREAARGGAVLAVWPEAATLVWPDEEGRWMDMVRTTAREANIDIVAAFVMPISMAPFAYRNEYLLAFSDGSGQQSYAKHHPVPGEPAVAGTGPAPVTEREWGRLSGAICYDYDFPAMARERAKVGADLVALPSSDWRGIDPVHAQMAALRAIESGHSILRATRFGLSLAVDAYGRVRAWQSAFEPGPGILYAALPRTRIRTLYAIWGDAPLAAAALVLAGLLAMHLARRHRGV